ncbi:MAG TPA: Gfo/Idh/MocA family oxidoreductase [Segetibacter sp.]
MEQKPINTALCSFGMSGWVFHAPFINVHPGFNLYGVWERTKNLAEEKYPGIKTFRSLDELLNDDAVELVVVNTPNATHYDYAKKVLLAGKHVIVEKPFTTEVSEGEELIELAASTGKVLSVYHNRRWDSDYRTVSQIVKENLLGEIVEAEIHYDRFKQELSPKVHKETPGRGTGVLYDLGSHLIDQALQLFGMPDAVFADILALRTISKVDDYFEVLLYYPNLRVRLKATYVAKETVPATVIHGTKGSFLKPKADVQEDMLQANISPSIEGWGTEAEEGKGLLNTIKDGVDIREYITSERGNYMGYYEGVYEAIRNNNLVPVSAEDGLNVIKIIKAAMQSNSEKRVIELLS